MDREPLPPDHRYVPQQTKCGEIARSIIDILFNSPDYRLTFDRVMWILDKVSRSEGAPIATTTPIGKKDKRIDWGTGITALYNMQHRCQQLDTGGTFLQLQCKQAMTCGVMLIGNNSNVTYRGRKLLKAVLPHTDKHCRRDWIDKCHTYLNKFLDDKSKALCDTYDNIVRESYVLLPF